MASACFVGWYGFGGTGIVGGCFVLWFGCGFGELAGEDALFVVAYEGGGALEVSGAWGAGVGDAEGEGLVEELCEGAACGAVGAGVFGVAEAHFVFEEEVFAACAAMLADLGFGAIFDTDVDTGHAT